MRYPPPTRPVAVERAAVGWWLALGCWFAGSSLGQFGHGTAAVDVPYPYARLQPGPAAVVLFALCSVFLASIVLAMRDGARWSRLALTGLAGPLAVFLVWQFGRSALFAPMTACSIGQATLSLVALAALPAAVRLMYRSEVGEFFTSR